MKYISKGMVIRASTEDLLFVTRCGVDFQLTGEQAALWLNGRFGFAKNRENVPEVKALQQLKRQGLVEITEGDEPVFEYEKVKALLGDSPELQELHAFWTPKKPIADQAYEELYRQIDEMIGEVSCEAYAAG